MKFKNLDIINTMNFLTQIAGRKLPQKLSYAIVKNIEVLRAEYNVYNKALSALLETYQEHTVKDENGEVVLTKLGIPDVDASVRADYVKELQELLEIETDVPVYQIPEATFDYDDAKYDSLSAQEILILIDTFCKNEV